MLPLALIAFANLKASVKGTRLSVFPLIINTGASIKLAVF
jgi:hypothetical protein